MAQTYPQLFDPLGSLGPFMLRACMVMQETFERRLDWDDELPPDLERKWIDEKWRIFWKVYVPTLHRRNGRLNSTRELQVGDIVVLKEHKNERGQWPIGKVTKILPRKKNSDATTVEIFVNGKTLVRATRGLSFLTKNN